MILAALLSTPQIIAEFDTQVEAMTCSDPMHKALRDLLLQSDGADPAALRAEAENRIGAEALESLFAARHVAITPCVRNPSDVDLARQTVAEELAKLDARRGLLAEIAEASEDLDGLADEALTWRLAQAAQAMTLAERAQQVDSAEYDTGPNGARMDKDERSAFAALLEKIESPKSGS